MCLEYENGCFRFEVKACNIMDRLLINLVVSGKKVQMALFTSYFLSVIDSSHSDKFNPSSQSQLLFSIYSEW